MAHLQDQQVIHHEEQAYTVGTHGIEVRLALRQHIQQQVQANVGVTGLVADGLVHVVVARRIAKELGRELPGVTVERFLYLGVDRRDGVAFGRVGQPFQ
ncbi:hypothetical protein D3C76_1352460 [compost metagenome]